MVDMEVDHHQVLHTTPDSSGTTSTTVTGNAIDGTTGTQVSNISATVTTDNNGNRLFP